MKKINILLSFLAIFTIAASEIDWEKVPQIRSGIRLYRGEEERPRVMKFAVMRIDLQQEGLQFTATGRAEHWGEPMPDYPACRIRTERVRTMQFMLDCRKKQIPVIVAFNASPWRPWCKPWNHRYGNPAGIGILDGKIIWKNDRRPSFIVYKNGKVDIVPSIPPKSLSEIQVAVGGFGIVLKEGKAVSSDSSLHPRIAYGLDAARKYLYILTVDGRQPGWSLGASSSDLARILLEAGAVDGINMDGGGSATLCYWNEAKKMPVMVNRHAGNGQRSVASNIGIWIRK